MDAFGDDDFSAPNEADFNGSAEVDVDPAADFLAREHDQLAGLEEDLIPEVETAPAVQGMFLGQVAKALLICCYSLLSLCAITPLLVLFSGICKPL